MILEYDSPVFKYCLHLLSCVTLCKLLNLIYQNLDNNIHLRKWL
jgi:hypothetical protein